MYLDPDKYWPTRATSQQALAVRLLCKNLKPTDARLTLVTAREAGVTQAPVACEHVPVFPCRIYPRHIH